MRVLQLWRYPVKSLQGEQLQVGELGPLGLHGDRRFVLLDLGTGFGLTARRAPEMLFASARLRGDGVEITLPDGSVAADDDALSAWLGRPVALRSTEQVAERRYEGPVGESESTEAWRAFTGSGHAFHDSGTSCLTLLSAATAAGHDPRRFRANVLLDGAGEDALVGCTARLGAAVLTITEPVARCVMVTRPQPGGIPLDRDVLRWIHRERGGVLAVGAAVAVGGTVRVGDVLA